MLTEPWVKVNDIECTNEPRRNEVKEIKAGIMRVLLDHKCTYGEAKKLLAEISEDLDIKMVEVTIE